MKGMKYWLVTTEHLKERLLFNDLDDFKAGMNYVALCSQLPHIKIMAFILMSNHIHFVLECELADAEAFVLKFKKLYSQYYSHKYSYKELLRKSMVDYKEIYLSDDSFINAIAYVQMNSVAANLVFDSFSYQWGTGSSFFGEKPLNIKHLGDLSARKRAAIMHSREPLPSHFLVHEDGYILPSSYVDVKFVESVFKSPNRMRFFLNKSSKAKISQNRNTISPTFNDQFLVSAVSVLCKSVFKTQSVEELTEIQMAELVRQLRYRFSAGINQISRVLNISLERTSLILDNFRG